MDRLRYLTVIALTSLLALTACRSTPNRATGFAFPIAQGDITQGREAFVRLGCPQCHTVSGVDLSGYSGQHFIAMPLGGELYFAKGYGDLVTSIVNPNHVLSGVYLNQLPPEQRTLANASPMYMALDMKVTELIDIVAFLNSRYALLPGYAKYYY